MHSGPQRWVSDVLDRFRDVQGGPKRWDALCPAHEDRKKSLTISIGDSGAIVICCMAPCRCELADILTAAELTHQELYPPEKRKYKGHRMSATTNATTKVERKFETSYDYRDPDGNLIYQVLRYTPKAFYQRRPNPAYKPGEKEDKEKNPKWLNNLTGITKVLYRLPELRAALKEKPDRWVWIPEGEKSVDLMVRLKLLAVCNPMGAMKWEDSYGKELKGCNVVVVADNDPEDATTGISPGHRHAQEVADNLLDNGANDVRVIVMPGAPPKGDFDEFYARRSAEGKSEEDILNEAKALVQKTKSWVKGSCIGQPMKESPAGEKKAEPKPEPKKEESKPKAEEKKADPPSGVNSDRQVENAGSVKPKGGKRSAASKEDFLKTVGQQIDVFVKQRETEKKGPPSTADLVGMVELTWSALKFEMSRLPGAVEPAIVMGGLVTMAAVIGEYLMTEGE